MTKDLSMLKINEITDISATIKELETIGYNESVSDPLSPTCTDTPWKHRNAGHLSATFHPGSTCQECRLALERFLNSLACHIQLYRGRITVHGILLETRKEGNPLFHGHFLIKSPKSRKTGKTVSRCKELHPSITEGVSDTALKSFTFEPLHDLKGAISYLTGPKNLSSPETIKSWKINQ